MRPIKIHQGLNTKARFDEGKNSARSEMLTKRTDTSTVKTNEHQPTKLSREALDALEKEKNVSLQVKVELYLTSIANHKDVILTPGSGFTSEKFSSEYHTRSSGE
jgi:hypothetical protein